MNAWAFISQALMFTRPVKFCDILCFEMLPEFLDFHLCKYK